MKVISAEATYTGGGIWVYTGQLESGEYFVGSDGWCLEVLDDDFSANWDEAMDGTDWEDAHRVRNMSEYETYEVMDQVLNTADMPVIDKEQRLEKVRNRTWIWN